VRPRIVVTSDVYRFVIHYNWIFQVTLVACSITIDEEETIPVVKVDIIIIVTGEVPIAISKLI